jgi:hypothetical protein
MGSKNLKSRLQVSTSTPSLLLLFRLADWLPAIARPKFARGLTPPALNENVHFIRCLAQLRSKTTAIEKNIYLGQLKDADPNMFYKLCLAHMSEITPLIYTPTVGDACLQYSQNFRRPEGLVSRIVMVIELVV